MLFSGYNEPDPQTILSNYYDKDKGVRPFSMGAALDKGSNMATLPLNILAM